ncbi:metallophosphoesterase [Caminibacter mediatlanticus]|uniref:Calcineurin-like phosphoesterase domain-containing protein n=1 Tax=Caminibacter mediatlanticus TB-2 TaxID=391592 RepID=A0AAI9AJ22_9BACT|nr:calcineurin-like phosphoesterase C-terminal domain-containing protein [Caminibacter mediatlanticus]EDM24578.1 hypothetical protein CMTB2_03643 [Caminibacter mediatlanticus TB-2]
MKRGYYFFSIGLVLLLSGCNDVSTNENSNVSTDSGVVVVGAATDAYIINGDVSIYDLNGKKLNTNSCKTGEYGYFECKVDNDVKKVIVKVSGGKIDSDGNLTTSNDEKDFNGSLYGLYDINQSGIVSPLTTKIFAKATNANFIYDEKNKISYIVGDVNLTLPKKIYDDVYDLEQNLPYNHFTLKNKNQVLNQVRNVTKILDSNYSIIKNFHPVMKRYGNLFFIHMADVHLTADNEVEDVFGGKIPPVTTVKEDIKEINSFNPNLVIQTGDIVALADQYPLDKDEEWYKLAKENIVDPIKNKEIPFLFAPGNHDPAGYKLKDVNKSDPRYYNGLIFKYILTNIDKTYYSYDYDNYHFIILDPKETEESGYRTVILPQEQLEWLKNELNANSDKFFIIAYHQPLGSWDKDSYQKFINLILPYKLRTLLIVGHTHDNRLIYRDGIPEYQGGAVCGDWWNTGKDPDGSPMGYAVYKIDKGVVYRFYKGTGLDKQINILNPVDVRIDKPTEFKLNIYNKNQEIKRVKFAIDGKIVGSLDLKKIDANNITWFNANGELIPNVDDKDHNVTFIIYTNNGEYNSTISYRFSKNKFFKISEILDDTNFKNWYGRFVDVNATIISVQSSGNLITLKDDSGKIVVWCGDTSHPEFKVGDKVYLRGQVTQFRDTKELKLISFDDVKIYDHEDINNDIYKFNNIQEAYDNFDKYQDKLVEVSGIVTADFGNFKVIQDTTRGIAIYLNTSKVFKPGTELSVTGTLTDYYGTIEIKPNSDEDIIAGGSTSTPEPKLVNITEILDNINNLIKVENVKVLEATSTSLIVSDGKNNLTIYTAKAGFNPLSKVNNGDIIDIIGIGAIYRDKAEIYPRSLEDIIIKQKNTVDNNITVLENIQQIYDKFDELKDKDVEVSGVVTANFGNNIAIEDESRGVVLYISSNIPEVNLGNKVKVKGKVTSYKGLVELDVYDSNLSIEGNGTIPEPKEITINELEQNMGNLVEIKNLKVESVSSSSITVSDDVNKTTVYCGKAKFDPTTFVNEGDIISVIGISGYYNAPQILPRSKEDIIK